ncbi:MAG: cellulase family glycosylhydrolase [Bradymonadales bacterium]|nr:cellulase family glycosylhydrolase [Bradymonadales bacterium]
MLDYRLPCWFALATVILSCGSEGSGGGDPDAGQPDLLDLEADDGDGELADTDFADTEPGDPIPETDRPEDLQSEAEGDALGDIEDQEVEEPLPTGWQTRGQRIIDPEGRQRILRGFNLSNDVKHPPYDSWAQEEDYRRLQTWGVSALRLLTTWAAIMPEPGVIDEEYLQKYDQRIEWAGRYNILIIMDMHQDVFGEGFGHNGAPRWACDEALYEAHVPREPWYANYQSPQVMECYGRFWSDTDLQDLFIQAVVTLAERYREEPHVIGIDLFNEPYWGPDTTVLGFITGQLQPFYQRVLDALGEVDKSYLYLVEPPPVMQWGLSPGFVPFGQANVVYAPHFYLPSIELENRYDGDTALIRLGLEGYQQTSLDLDIPWILGEWGGFTSATNYDEYMRDALAILESLHAGDLYYEYSQDDGGYSLLNSAGEEKPLLVDISARIYPKAVGGTLVEYHFDDQSGVFTMVLETLEQVTAPSILAFPKERHYPDGFVIESSDPDGSWSYEVDEERSELLFTIDRTKVRHTLTIRPLGGYSLARG